MNLPELADAQAHLNLQPSELPELEGRLHAAVSLVEELVGPLTPRTIVERHNHRGGPVLLLRNMPVLGLTQVSTVGGLDAQTFAPEGFVVEPSGVLTYLGVGRLPVGWLQVTYLAGRPLGELPADLHEAVLTQTSLLWYSQRRGSAARTVMGEAQGAAITPAVRRLEQLLAPHLLPTGVA